MFRFSGLRTFQPHERNCTSAYDERIIFFLWQNHPPNLGTEIICSVPKSNKYFARFHHFQYGWIENICASKVHASCIYPKRDKLDFGLVDLFAFYTTASGSQGPSPIVRVVSHLQLVIIHFLLKKKKKKKSGISWIIES